MPSIDIKLIDVMPGRRKLNPTWVEVLAHLFANEGQQSPIEVVEAEDRYRLVYGNHRLAAANLLGWKEVRAEVRKASHFSNEAEITLREITENLARRNLSVLDKAVDIARWREAYNAAHIVSKGGRPKKNAEAEELTAKFAASFSAVAQKAFDISQRSIFLSVKIASIATDVRDRISLLPLADNQSELLRLAGETTDRQASIAALLTTDPPQAVSVSDAIAIIDRLPKPVSEPRWQKVSTAFSNLKEGDQNRFFDLQEAAIQRWLKGRSA